MSRELRELIFRMMAGNPTWGAPRTHGELKMLGFDISERTGLALDAEGSEESCVGKALVDFPEQPP